MFCLTFRFPLQSFTFQTLLQKKKKRRCWEMCTLLRSQSGRSCLIDDFKIGVSCSLYARLFYFTVVSTNVNRFSICNTTMIDMSTSPAYCFYTTLGTINFWPLATERSLLPVRRFGTVCHTTLLTECHWRHSAGNWKLFCCLYHFMTTFFFLVVLEIFT